MQEFPIVEVRGKTHREMGRVIGEQLQSAIEEILSELEIPGKHQSSAARSIIAGSFQERMSRYAPELLEEMKGIAEGSGVPKEHIFIYNDLPEMWQADEFMQDMDRGCTALGFSDSPLGPIVGKNNDIGENKAKYHIPHRYSFPNGRKALISTWPGTVWAAAFVNDHGVATGGASVGSATINPDGFPSNFDNRVLAERAKSLQEALELIRSLPISSHAFTGILADEEAILGLEVSVGGMAVKEPINGACWGVNHFIESEMITRQNVSAEILANSWARWVRLEERTKSVPHTVDGMKSILAYHADWGSICQHGKGPKRMHSSASYVMIPKERKIHFTYGKPCETEWVEIPMEHP